MLEAANHNIEQSYQLALDLENGNGMAKNQVKAYYIYLELAEQGHILSKVRLGGLYFNNIFSPFYQQSTGNEPRLPLILRSLKESCIVDDDLSFKLDFESIIKCNLFYAKKLFEAAAAADCAEAWCYLGEIYCNDIFLLKDFKKAQECFVRSIELGHNLARSRLAEIKYTSGDKAPAIKLYQEAAALGCKVAIFSLAVRYDLGIDFPEDRVLSTSMLIKAAELGHGSAQYVLSQRYMLGDGVAKDPIEGLKLCLNAAEKGHPMAQNVMGLRFATGEGVKQNPINAIKWYRKAASQGNREAFFNLGVLYQQGCGEVAVDLELSIKYYKKAALQGHIAAKMNLEFLYQLLYCQTINVARKDPEVLWLANFYLARKNQWSPTDAEKIEMELIGDLPDENYFHKGFTKKIVDLVNQDAGITAETSSKIKQHPSAINCKLKSNK